MTKARELLQQTDDLIKQFPEVKTVFGKAGRAETATDPAPPSMFETTITLRRDKDRWRTVPVHRFFSSWPGVLRKPLGAVFPLARPITIDEMVYGYNWPDGTHVPGLNEVMNIPGLTNSWTMPIKTRIDMLSTGIKTPVGIKVMGPDLETLSELSNRIAQVVKTSEGTSQYTVSAFPEKSVGGNYFDIEVNRDEIARYGLTVGDVQDVIMSAMGGMNIGGTVEGLQRYPINLRYPQELRDNLQALKQTLIATPGGAQVPLDQAGDLPDPQGPAHDQERERPAHELGVRGHRGDRRRDLRGQRPEGGEREGPAPVRLQPGVVGAVRVHGSGAEAAHDRGPAGLRGHRPAALPLDPELAAGGDRPSGGAVQPRRRDLAALVHGVPPLAGGDGGDDRPGRTGRRDRCW